MAFAGLYILVFSYSVFLNVFTDADEELNHKSEMSLQKRTKQILGRGLKKKLT